jgi:hypothetical protein
MAGIAAATIGAGGAIIGGAFKFFSGQSQKKQAEQIAKNNPFQPEDMPYQVGLSTRLAQDNYLNGMPGFNTAQQQIRQNAGNAGALAAKGATSGGDLIDAANKIQVNSDEATRQLALQASSYKSNALGGYQAALDTQAGWQDKLYKNNQLDPYLRAANQSAALTGAGNINQAAGIDDALTGVTSGLGSYLGDKKASMYNPDGSIKTMGQYKGLDDLSASSVSNIPSVNSNSLLALSALFGGK